MKTLKDNVICREQLYHLNQENNEDTLKIKIGEQYKKLPNYWDKAEDNEKGKPEGFLLLRK